MKKIIAIVTLLFAVAVVSAQSIETPIIPRPMEATAVKGSYTLSAKSVIAVADAELVRPAELFAEYVAKDLGATLTVKQQNKGAVVLSLDKSLAKEEYALHISSKGVKVVGSTAQGVYYGLQSLRQLVAAGEVTKKGIELQGMDIKDKPLLGHRGAMLDVCRHFFTVAEVKRFIDIAAMHKINAFHWHLTEDQGWRIEIKKYPELIKIGSMRKETVIGRNSISKTYDGTPHGGYYTQEEIKDIVKYAAERYIEVIPEIDMPGHMVAALASYNHLGCRDEKFEVRTRWGISKDVLCVGKESTFEFVEGVLEEVVKLFPSKYIHLGGDECPRDRWKECPHCQKRIQEEGLKDENELQSYFMHRVEKFLAKHDRKIIGWDEIIYGGINKSATIMLWNDRNRAKAISLGNDVILTPKYFCYMDYYQTLRPFCNKEGLLFRDNRILTLRKAYSLDPYEGLQPSEYGRIKGVQANLWTEYISTFHRVQEKLLPRLAATAEAGWTIGAKNFEDFARRLEHLRKLYEKECIHYAPYFFDGVDEK
ncbi:MAG: beta-N-acetylhexosaminidase [Alistipes sp.]|nr:beta-N-acetylhexosaminidase [Alistipes sp.]